LSLTRGWSAGACTRPKLPLRDETSEASQQTRNRHLPGRFLSDAESSAPAGLLTHELVGRLEWQSLSLFPTGSPATPQPLSCSCQDSEAL
jgi:hypothetical protein